MDPLAAITPTSGQHTSPKWPLTQRCIGNSGLRSHFNDNATVIPNRKKPMDVTPLVHYLLQYGSPNDSVCNFTQSWLEAEIACVRYLHPSFALPWHSAPCIGKNTGVAGLSGYFHSLRKSLWTCWHQMKDRISGSMQTCTASGSLRGNGDNRCGAMAKLMKSTFY